MPDMEQSYWIILILILVVIISLIAAVASATQKDKRAELIKSDRASRKKAGKRRAASGGSTRMDAGQPDGQGHDPRGEEARIEAQRLQDFANRRHAEAEGRTYDAAENSTKADEFDPGSQMPPTR